MTDTIHNCYYKLTRKQVESVIKDFDVHNDDYSTVEGHIDCCIVEVARVIRWQSTNEFLSGLPKALNADDARALSKIMFPSPEG